MKTRLLGHFTLLLLFIGLFQLQFCFAQKTEDLIATGKKAFVNHDFNAAYQAFVAGFSDTMTSNTDLYYYGIAAAAKTGHLDQAFQWLGDYTQLVASPQVNFYRLQFDLDSLYKDARWPAYLKAMQTKLHAADLNKGYNIELKETLYDLFFLDQKDRILIAPYQQIYGDTSKQMASLWDRIDYYDSLNLEKLLRLWDKNGWISKKQVGETAIYQWVIIQHADLSVQKKYFPLLKKAKEVGDIKAGSLALTIDRIRDEEGKKQIYGSQIARIKWQGKYFNIISPLEDPAHVDERRKEMGLEPIASYADHFGIKWSLDNYKADIQKLEEAQERVQ